MADNIQHLILEKSRVLRNQIKDPQREMQNDFGDVKHRITRVESAVAGIRATSLPELLGLESDIFG